MKTRTFAALILAFLGLASVGPVSAAIVYEGFNYPGTELGGASGGGEEGLAGTWNTNVVPGSGRLTNTGLVTLSGDGVSLSHPGLQPGTGGRLTDAGGTGIRPFDNGFSINNGIDQTYYFSILAQGSALLQAQSGPTSSSNNRFLMGIDANGTKGGATPHFTIGHLESSTGNSRERINTYDGGKVYNPNETYFMVGRLDAMASASDLFYLKVYDSTMMIDVMETTAYDINAFASVSGVNNTHLSVGFIAGVPGALDEIRIGSTWAEVTPGAVAVPEPSSMLFGAVAGVSLLVRRRRRKPASSCQRDAG